jgi:3-deoxy-D-manno-octulosonic-acid transferase
LSSVRVQDAESVGRLARIGVVAEVCGDPRFDRVLKVADAAVFPAELEPVRTWVAGRPCVVAGSTWPAEEGALAAWWPGEEVALIVAPHEVNEVHIAEVIATFPGASRFAQGGPFTGSVLVVDGIGWLSRLYALADVAVVGGGFGKGIHNVLEPAAHGVPTVVGPRTERFREAQQLERIGGLQRVRRPSELAASLANWLNDQAARQSAGASARAYSESGRGAGERIAVGLECAIDSLEKP